MGEGERRRRRHRHAHGPAAETAAAPVAETPPVHDPEPQAPPERPARAPHHRNDGNVPGNGPGNGPGAEDRETERGLRGLVGAGASQVSVRAALRARDAARPTDADLVDAEANLKIVRRNWVPREDLPRNGR